MKTPPLVEDQRRHCSHGFCHAVDPEDCVAPQHLVRGGFATGLCEQHFTVSGDTVVSAALEDDLVAVMWESVANAIRHGRATTVTVALCVDDETLSLVVTDNGRWTATADTASSGLAGLCERAAAWRGRAVVEHGDDLTRVVWRIPLDSTGHPLAGG